MAAGELLDAPELSLERIDARSGGENFPVASVLAPRVARPHLRAIYGFARLVDNLGDEAPGDRVALLDALAAELTACYDGAPRTAIMRRLQRTIRACDLQPEPFRRLIGANRIDQRADALRDWADVREYCTYSAEPVGRLVLGVYGEAGKPELVAHVRRRLHGAPARELPQDPPRDLALGRIYLPPRTCAASACRAGACGPGARTARHPAPLRKRPCGGSARRGLPLAAALGGRRGRSVALFARGGLAALAALERAGWDVFDGRPAPGCDLRVADAPRARPAVSVDAAYAEARGSRGARRATSPGGSCSCRGRSGSRSRPLRVRAPGRRHRGRRGRRTSGAPSCASRRAVASSCSRTSAEDPVMLALADAVVRYPVPQAALARPRRRGALGRRRGTRYRKLGRAARVLPSRRRRGRRRVHGGLRAVAIPSAARPLAETLGAGAAADQHHARRPRGLALGRVYLPLDELDAVRGRGGRHRRGPAASGVARAHGPPGARGPGRCLRRARASAAARLPQRPLRADARGDLRGLLDEIERRAYDVFTTRPSLSAFGKLRVIGGARRKRL